jgi:hypothetical protein
VRPKVDQKMSLWWRERCVRISVRANLMIILEARRERDFRGGCVRERWLRIAAKEPVRMVYSRERGGWRRPGDFDSLGREGAPFGGRREVGVDVEGCGDFPVADVFEDDGPEFWWEGWPCSFLFGWGGRASLVGEDRDAVVEISGSDALPYGFHDCICAIPRNLCFFLGVIEAR